MRRSRMSLARRNRAIRKRNRTRILSVVIVGLLAITGLFSIIKSLPFFNNKEKEIAQAPIRSDVGGDVEIKEEDLISEDKTNEKIKKEGFTDKLQKFYTTKEAAKIYASTNELADMVTEVPMGDYLESYGREGDWLKVVYKNQVGYIKADLLKDIEDPKLFKVVDGILIINDKYNLPENYAPLVNEAAKKSFDMMKAEMNRNKMDIKIISDYRSYEEQKNLYNKDLEEKGEEYVASYTAKPGKSEHQSGLAFDFGLNNKDKYVNKKFDETKEAEWLSKNAYKYGFILRYPRNKEEITGYDYESWHYRYVGPEIAKKIYESGLTIEEYYDL